MIEAATEKEEVKRKIFAELCPSLSPEAIVASNTSSISITRLASSTDRPEQFIGIHFMNPVPLMELVELIRGIATADATFEAAKEFVTKLGKTIAVAEDFPAFIVNRILLPMINEAIYTLYEGVGNVEAIDTAMRLGAHHPMGPLELADFIGLDTCLSVMQVLHEGLADSKYRPCPLLVKYVEAGWLGRKTAARLLRLSRRQAGPDALMDCAVGLRLGSGARPEPGSRSNTHICIVRNDSGRVCVMNSVIRNCLPPDRNPRKPKVMLPKGSIDTHVHVFEQARYKMNPDRGYNPPDSTLADLKHLHATLGVERVVFTQPSTYGTDNSAILDGMTALNAETPNRARCVVAITMDISDKELAALNDKGARGVRLNTDNKGGMPIGFDQIGELEARIKPFGWHLEWLFPGKDILDLMPVFKTIKVPMSIGHFAYQPATAGVQAPGFQALLGLMRDGNTWMKISGANRVSATDLPPYDDVAPMAHALIEAAPDRIMWGTDWPHPNKYLVNPNDGDLVDAFGDWVTDANMRRKIMVDTPARFYRF